MLTKVEEEVRLQYRAQAEEHKVWRDNTTSCFSKDWSLQTPTSRTHYTFGDLFKVVRRGLCLEAPLCWRPTVAPSKERDFSWYASGIVAPPSSAVSSWPSLLPCRLRMGGSEWFSLHRRYTMILVRVALVGFLRKRANLTPKGTDRGISVHERIESR